MTAVWFRPHRHRCPEAATRDRMDDGEFWAHVLADLSPDEDDDGYQYEPVPDDALRQQLGSPCPDCGSLGACAYDAEGRPLIHAQEVED